MSGAPLTLLTVVGATLLAQTPPAQYNPYASTQRPGMMPYAPVSADPGRNMSSYFAAPSSGQPQGPPIGYGGYDQYAAPRQYAPAAAPASMPAPAYMGAAPIWPGYGAGLGMIGAGPGVGYGSAMQGLASYTQASGQYWNDIQSARLSREDVHQKQIDTKRKQLEFEYQYEQMRPTTQKMVRAERAAELQWARDNPPLTEIWSGKTFNVLLRSILDAPNPTGGPNITLDPPVIRAINLTDNTTRANLSLAKDEGKIDWPELLLEKPFDEYRNGFQKSFEKAIQSTSSGTPLDRDQLRNIRGDLDALSNKLDDMVRDISPSQYIGSRRILNQLRETVNGLGNARVVRSANQAWKKDVHTVAQLVNHCLRNGLTFGPAVAPEDHPYYTALYYAIRSYERGLVGQ